MPASNDDAEQKTASPASDHFGGSQHYEKSASASSLAGRQLSPEFANLHPCPPLMSTISPPTQISTTSETGTHSPTATAMSTYNPPILSVPSSIWGTGPATTVLNAGVLPTDFVLSPECNSLRNLVSSSIVTAGTTELQSQWFFADKCDTAAQPETQCLPQGFDSNYGYQLRASSVDAYMPVYSEGSSCPNGYTSACEVVTTNIWFINAGETNTVAVGCCPSNYQCGSTGLSCSSHPTAGATIQGSCQSGQSTAWTATIAKENQGVGCAPRIVYLETRSNGTGSTGLSGGIKAAIVIPVLLAVIISCTAVYVLYRRRRRQRRKDAPTNDILELAGDSEPIKAEADAKSTERIVYELPDSGVLEAPEDAFAPGELSGVAKESESAADGDDAPAGHAEDEHPTRFSFDSKQGK